MLHGKLGVEPAPCAKSLVDLGVEAVARAVLVRKDIGGEQLGQVLADLLLKCAVILVQVNEIEIHRGLLLLSSDYLAVAST